MSVRLENSDWDGHKALDDRVFPSDSMSSLNVLLPRGEKRISDSPAPASFFRAGPRDAVSSHSLRLRFSSPFPTCTDLSTSLVSTFLSASSAESPLSLTNSDDAVQCLPRARGDVAEGSPSAVLPVTNPRGVSLFTAWADSSDPGFSIHILLLLIFSSKAK